MEWKEWKIERVYTEIVVIVPLFVLKSFVKTNIVIYDPEGADVDGQSYGYSLYSASDRSDYRLPNYRVHTILCMPRCTPRE